MAANPSKTFASRYLERLAELVGIVPAGRIESIAEVLLTAHQGARQVFVIGNGGSATTAAHMAADLGSTMISPDDRRLRIVSLSENLAIMTAVANDLGYERMFSEQLVDRLQKDDVLIAISGSGNSPNVLEAMRFARLQGATVVALVGFDGGAAVGLADVSLVVPSSDYGLVEDLHLAVSHALTGSLRERLGSRPAPAVAKALPLPLASVAD